MRRNELTIVVSLVVIGLLAAFWLVALSPKREQANGLKQDIDQLRSALEQAEQSIAIGEQEQKSFPTDYRRLVVLGKAVPGDGDQAGLLVQLQKLADRAGVRFQALALSATAGATTSSDSAPTSTDATSTSSTETTTASSSASSESSALPAEPPVAATEASAAALPIGASVGPAGLPVMPYQLKFTGDFFEIADFLESIDGLVDLGRDTIDVHGRLLTVDGFALEPDDADTSGQTGAVSAIPTLTADLSVTTYLTPPDQGITAGASTGGPAPATSTTASVPSSEASATTTAATSP